MKFIAPKNVVYRKIDSSTGLMPTPYCPKENLVTEVFVKDAAPSNVCFLHKDQPYFEESQRIDRALDVPVFNRHKRRSLDDPPATKPDQRRRDQQERRRRWLQDMFG